MANTPYTIFERMSAYTDPRVRWHKVRTLQAKSRPDALRNFLVVDDLVVSEGCVIDRTTTAVLVGDPLGGPSHLMMAERSDRINFEHYDFDGTFVPAPPTLGLRSREAN